MGVLITHYTDQNWLLCPEVQETVLLLSFWNGIIVTSTSDKKENLSIPISASVRFIHVRLLNTSTPDVHAHKIEGTSYGSGQNCNSHIPPTLPLSPPPYLYWPPSRLMKWRHIPPPTRKHDERFNSYPHFSTEENKKKEFLKVIRAKRNQNRSSRTV